MKMFRRQNSSPHSYAHIINPVEVDQKSDLYHAQPVTFKSMREARKFARGTVEVKLLYTNHLDEKIQSIKGFVRAKSIGRYVSDIYNFDIMKPLPLIRDILDSLYESSEAEYFIYTNVDIALMPHFYMAIDKIVREGFDGFVINRRTIPATENGVRDMPSLYSKLGIIHPGHDCFVFKRNSYQEFLLGDACVGANWIGKVLYFNVLANSNSFREFKTKHLTFHLGDRQEWRDKRFEDYDIHNEKTVLDILDKHKNNDKFNRNDVVNRVKKRIRNNNNIVVAQKVDGKMIGLMMIKGESDILHDVLTNVTRFYDRILVLIGDEPGEQLEKTCEILGSFSEVVSTIRDERTKGPFPIRDGARYYLLNKAREMFGTNNWIGVLHGDEIYTKDPRPYLAYLDYTETPVFSVRLCHFFLHTTDEAKWNQIQSKPVEQRITHYMWPGTPEDRIFFDDGCVNYDPARHSLVVPYEHGSGRHLCNEFVIKQYNYRSPENMLLRAKNRIGSKWQKNHYEHIVKDKEFFVDSLHVFGYEPCGWDNKQADIQKQSQPRSLGEYPLPSVDSTIIPVFIGGSGRSGTTVTKELLARQRNFAALAWESKFISWKNGILDLLYDYSNEKSELFIARMLDESISSYPEYEQKNVLNWKFRITDGNQVNIENYYHELKQLVRTLANPEMSFETRKNCVSNFVHYLFDRLVFRKKARAWIEQTPLNFSRADQLLECFSNALFINIYRDPRDVLASMLKLWWGPKTIEEGINYYKKKNSEWKRVKKKIYKSKNDKRMLDIGFEDLVRNRGEKLAVWLNSHDLETEKMDYETEKANIGRWETDFSSSEKKILVRELEQELMDLGYL